MRSRYSAAVACAVLLAALRTTPQAVAQGRDGLHHLAVVAGPVNYDLSGTGWSWGAGARLDLPLARILTVEGGITYFQYEAQFGSRVSYVFPESARISSCQLGFCVPTCSLVAALPSRLRGAPALIWQCTRGLACARPVTEPMERGSKAAFETLR